MRRVVFIHLWFTLAVHLASLGCRVDGSETATSVRPVEEDKKAGQQRGSKSQQIEEEAVDEVVIQQGGNADRYYEQGIILLKKGKDYPGTIRLFETACGGGSASACYKLGIMYREGQGVRRDEAKAYSWFQTACAMGSQTACDLLGH